MPLDKTVGMAFVNGVGAATDTPVVAAVPGRAIRALAVAVSAGAAPGSATFTSKPAGAGTPISATFSAEINGSIVLPEGGGWFQTARGEGLSVTTVGAGPTGVQVTYALVTV